MFRSCDGYQMRAGLPSHFFICIIVRGPSANIYTIDCFINCLKSELERSALSLNNGLLQIVNVKKRTLQ